jgi:ubiquitin-conjugating enzyme E2 Q
VDLLISFCYASAKGRRIREYPTGLSLQVPLLSSPQASSRSYHDDSFMRYETPPVPSPQPSVTAGTEDSSKDPGIVKYDSLSHEIILDADQSFPLRRGDWIVLSEPNGKL